MPSRLESTDYAMPGPLTGLGGVPAPALAGLPADPVAICRLAGGLVLHPMDTGSLGLPACRFESNQLRPAAAIAGALLVLDPAPLRQARPPERRVVGTCRHFVVLACALLRHVGIAARARCGFGTRFQPGLALDHWITEYLEPSSGRWVRVDVQHLAGWFVPDPADLAPAEFLTGGAAWAAYRDGTADAACFGVPGTENFGPAEIRGNAIRDLAALCMIEMLPWDEWGRMSDSYAGRTGDDYDLLLDEIAATCAADDPEALRALYGRADLAVPPDLIDDHS